MCGVVGIAADCAVNQSIYDALTVMQHRGQDAAGIVTSDGRNVFSRKKNGLVRDVFQQRHMEKLVGNFGVGHVRYPTAGCSSNSEAQPFYVNSPYGIVLAHNGNLTNADAISAMLVAHERRHLNTGSDSEVLLNVFAHELALATRDGFSADRAFDAVAATGQRCRGGYAVVGLVIGQGLFAFRDPWGIRPLVLGSRQSGARREYMLASESVALDALGFRRERDVRPGEAVFVDTAGQLSSRQCVPQKAYSPCVFEFVYFARPDSIVDGISVYKARLRMGDNLAEKILRQRPDHDIDVVIPIPDTSRTAAVQVAHGLGAKYREGFIKNRYIGRTFIMPGQALRESSVRRKLNAIDLEFRDKNVLLVDDSIVRGTTSQQIVRMARDAGARKVYFASAAPPVRYPNVYGIDMPAAHELVAHGRDEAQIEKEIGADWLVYQDLDGLIDSVRHEPSGITQFDASCFSGEYVTRDITPDYLESVAARRGEPRTVAAARHVSV